MAVDNTKLNFNSSLPIDKVVGYYEGTFTVTGFDNGTFTPGTGSTTVTHNKNKRCFPELQWSSDGTNYREAPSEDSDRVGVLAAVDTNDATIYAYQSLGTSSKTIHYRLSLLWP